MAQSPDYATPAFPGRQTENPTSADRLRKPPMANPTYPESGSIRGPPEPPGRAAARPHRSSAIAERRHHPARMRRSQFWNLGASFKDGLPFQPWATELHRQRVETNSKDNPDAHCLPLGVMQLHTHGQPRKIVQTPGSSSSCTRQTPACARSSPMAAPSQRPRTMVVRLLGRQMGRRHARGRIRAFPTTSAGSMSKAVR